MRHPTRVARRLTAGRGLGCLAPKADQPRPPHPRGIPQAVAAHQGGHRRAGPLVRCPGPAAHGRCQGRRHALLHPHLRGGAEAAGSFRRHLQQPLVLRRPPRPDPLQRPAARARRPGACAHLLPRMPPVERGRHPAVTGGRNALPGHSAEPARRPQLRPPRRDGSGASPAAAPPASVEPPRSPIVPGAVVDPRRQPPSGWCACSRGDLAGALPPSVGSHGRRRLAVVDPRRRGLCADDRPDVAVAAGPVGMGHSVHRVTGHRLVAQREGFGSRPATRPSSGAGSRTGIATRPPRRRRDAPGLEEFLVYLSGGVEPGV